MHKKKTYVLVFYEPITKQWWVEQEDEVRSVLQRFRFREQEDADAKAKELFAAGSEPLRLHKEQQNDQFGL